MAASTLGVPGLGAVPVNPTPQEAQQIIKRGHSYVATVDLSTSGISSNFGTINNYSGFGLYLMHRSPANTIFEVRFDQDFGNQVEFRRGTLHKPGPVGLDRNPYYFSRFWTLVVQSGDTTGTAYFLVLGSPESIYIEDAAAIPYQPSATTTSVGTSITTVLTSVQVHTVKGLRLYVQNRAGTALTSAPIEISPDGTNFETILNGTFDTIAASTFNSVNIPAGVRYLRMRALTGSSSTSINTALVGTMG